MAPTRDPEGVASMMHRNVNTQPSGFLNFKSPLRKSSRWSAQGTGTKIESETIDSTHPTQGCEHTATCVNFLQKFQKP